MKSTFNYLVVLSPEWLITSLGWRMSPEKQDQLFVSRPPSVCLSVCLLMSIVTPVILSSLQQTAFVNTSKGSVALERPLDQVIEDKILPLNV